MGVPKIFIKLVIHRRRWILTGGVFAPDAFRSFLFGRLGSRGHSVLSHNCLEIDVSHQVATCGEGGAAREFVIDLVHQSIVVLLLGHHVLDVTLIGFLHKVVEPAAVVAALRLLLDHERGAAHVRLLIRQQQVLKLLD